MDIATDPQRAWRQAWWSGILGGVGLGGFLDGIVLHQILQWHNLLSSRLPPDTLERMHVNMRADGWFHVATWLATAAAIAMLYRVARTGVALPPGRWYVGLLLLGWGAFNVVEGVIDHQLLGIHHVRGWGPDPVYDYGFLVGLGLVPAAIGWLLVRGAERRSRARLGIE